MAGTLSTEATTVINELPCQGNPDNRPNVVALYAKAVAVSHLGVYPPDDDTVVTNAWVRNIGGTAASPSVFTIGTGLTLSFATSAGVTTPTIVATNPATTALSATSTRGAVRRLLTALNITYTSPGVG